MARAVLEGKTRRSEIMEKMLIATFDDEKKAYEASRILKELDADGSIDYR